MLVSLTVRDFALFSSASFSPGAGFCALTGQTGAGKSLIVDALAFVAGHRKGREIIRTGCEKCEVRAFFSPVDAGKQAALAALGIETEADGIEFYRSLSAEGRGVCRINGSQTTLGVLREAARSFLDIHEQEDAHALLDPASHLFYLDAFSPRGERDPLEEYRTLYGEYDTLKRTFQSLYSADRREEKARREFLTYQIRELEEAKIRPGEAAELEAQRDRLQHAKKLSDACACVQGCLQAEGGAYDLLMRASESLSASAEIVPEWKAIAERLETIGYEVADLARSALPDEEQGEDADSALERIDARLRDLRRLFSLYAPSEEGLTALLAEKKEQLYAIDHAREEARRLHAEALGARELAAACAERLREKRRTSAAALEREVGQALAALDMPGVRFEVRILPLDKLREDGMDRVEFYIGTNVGQPMMPLSAIASGGELSRILLALRCVLSRLDHIDTLVFDEIDTGVSGKSAVKIGRAMRALGRERQVLAVTHSAQVASAAHAQIKVEKQVADAQTVASVYPLDEAGRLKELARILGGEEISETSLAAARELLEMHQK